MASLSGQTGVKRGYQLPPGKSGSNWVCADCGNDNYADRMKCNRCKIPRAECEVVAAVVPVMEEPRGGGGFQLPQGKSGVNWTCFCGNDNYADRTQCHRCKVPRAQCEIEQQPDFKRPRIDIPPAPAGTGHREGKAFPVQRSSGPRWKCSACNNDNYPDREACNRCRAPRTESQWRCNLCSHWNYLDLTECERCAAAPGAEMDTAGTVDAFVVAIRALRPDCDLNSCANPDGTYDPKKLMLMLKEAVRKMEARFTPEETTRPPRTQAGAPQASAPAMMRTAVPVNSGVPPTMSFGMPGNAAIQGVATKPGSWQCAECGNWNYADRTTCNRCGAPPKEIAPRTPGPQLQISMKPGSWKCEQCGNWNFADRTECNRCKAPK